MRAFQFIFWTSVFRFRTIVLKMVKKAEFSQIECDVVGAR
jgi:hypothetical protein